MVTQIPTGGTQPCRAVCIGLLVGLMVTLVGGQTLAQGPAEGTLTLGLPYTITPALLNPAETTGQTASMLHYALHDALLKPLPGQPMAPALAESWTESPDGLTYEFTLRQGLTFHNGDPFTAADVAFSFGRYQGVFAALLHEKVQAVEIRDPHHVRFVLQAPWPDFLRRCQLVDQPIQALPGVAYSVYENRHASQLIQASSFPCGDY
jgi:peptide/nickel transport system substrate-binding protein